MGVEVKMAKDGSFYKDSSRLLELAAADDLEGFLCEVENKGFDVDDPSYWYGRRVGSKKMGLEERSPLLIAAMYGSTRVLKYIIGKGTVDVNRACGLDGATALHCATAGGSGSSVEVAKILIDASADVDAVDANGKKPCDLIPPNLKSLGFLERKKLESLLRRGMSIEEGFSQQEQENQTVTTLLLKEGNEKKDYPDVSLPDINSGVYATDEFRMYSFKIKPCSRAYSHDWTECPFVHPGENARRRDPKKFQYSCVPCPDFKKGSCANGDNCEYAHGVFESWLHPAQYRTRLCKDEIGCSRKVCFFAHKPVELRPVYASTGSGLPSPTVATVSSMDMGTPRSLALGSSASPMSPSTALSSPIGGSTRNTSPPPLQLLGSRLKTGMTARDLELEMELLGGSICSQEKQRQQLMEGLARSSPSSWSRTTANLEDVVGSPNSSLLSQFQALSPRISTTSTWCQSPTSIQTRHNANQHLASYPSEFSTPSLSYTSGAVAAAVMNSRSAAFKNRSQSFIDRRANNSPPGFTGTTSSMTPIKSNLSDWSSPDGRLEWGFNSGDMSKLQRSASFNPQNGYTATVKRPVAPSTVIDEPDVSWVNSLVKDVPSSGAGLYSSDQKHGDISQMFPSWVERLRMEQEQTVA